MPKNTETFGRLSALDGIAIAGNFGTSGKAGVNITVCPPRSVVLISARKGKTAALSKATKKHLGLATPKQGCSNYSKGTAIHWAGPEQWYVVGQGEQYDDLCQQLSGIASVVDQSHGRITIVLSGNNARDVLAKGTPVDLHSSVFKPGNCAVTEMAHTAVHVAKTADNEFEISLYRGFAESFWEWLCEMSLEFGYEVK